MNKNFIIIGNPIAGGGALAKIKKAEQILKSKGADVVLQLTTKKGDAEAFARKASALPGTILIAAGGDGTYNEVANGLVHSDTPLAILPLGTTSVLARELGISLDTEKAIAVALSGRTETAHLGRIKYLSGESRLFLLMAGIGYDGDSVCGVNERLKKYSGKLAYILSGTLAIINYRPSKLEITATITSQEDFKEGNFRVHPGYCSVSGNSMTGTAYSVIVSKASCYGGDFKIAPDASLTAPYHYVFMTHTKSRIALLRYLSAIISGRTLGLKDISYFRTDEITIDGSSHIQLDGDYAGTAPVKIDVVRDAIKLIMPR